MKSKDQFLVWFNFFQISRVLSSFQIQVKIKLFGTLYILLLKCHNLPIYITKIYGGHICGVDALVHIIRWFRVQVRSFLSRGTPVELQLCTWNYSPVDNCMDKFQFSNSKNKRKKKSIMDFLAVVL